MNLAKLIPSWVWAALLAAGLAAAGWLHLQKVVAERDGARAQLETARGEAAALESALVWRREQDRRLREILARREQALADAHEMIRGHLDDLARLEQSDEKVADWADGDVPDAVADWLRAIADPDSDRAGAGDAPGP